MKVALIALCRRGGTLKCAGRLAERLAQRADTISIFSADADQLLLPKGTPILKVPTGGNRIGGIFHTLNPTSYIRIIRQVRAFHPDTVIFPVEHLWHLVLHALLSDFPILQTIHDPKRHLGAENRVYDFVRNVELAFSDRIVVLSAAFRDKFLRYGFLPHNVDVIPHGTLKFDEDVLPEGKIPPPPMKGRILFCGTISRYKGIDVLLKAFTSVLAKHPDASLILVGSGDLAPYAELLASARNVTVINRYVNECELAGLHAECDFVVAPYVDASQSGAVAVALANGRTVVVTSAGGLKEQVQHGITGLLVEPNDQAALANSICQLLRSPDLVINLGQKAAEVYAEQYSWDKIASEYLRACELAKNQRQSVNSQRWGLVRSFRRAFQRFKSSASE